MGSWFDPETQNFEYHHNLVLGFVSIKLKVTIFFFVIATASLLKNSCTCYCCAFIVELFISGLSVCYF